MYFFAGTSAQPRDYQSRICDKAIQMFDGHWQNHAGETPPSAKSVLIDAPTSCGKTVIGLAIAQYGHSIGKRIGWVAMRRNLLVQAAQMRDKFGFNVPDMKFISMFDRNPPTDVDWLFVDECLPYNVLVDTLVNGIPRKVTIGDIVTKNIGTHVLSYSHESNSLDYQLIKSRARMGIKPVLEFTIMTDNGIKQLWMTDNGRIWTQNGYRRADSVNIGDGVLHIESCDPVNVLQDGSILTNFVGQGKIISISRIESEETFDISVSNNHNFFANSILVHNCSHDATDSMAHIHSSIQPEKVIGLSATPYRSDHARLSFERVIKDVGIHELIDQGWLSPYSHFTIPSYNPESVTDLYSGSPDRWGKSIMFFLTMAECEATRALLEKNGTISEIVWGGSDRFDQLQRFQEGKIQVLISMSILTEGFDSEDLQTVFVRPSSKGPTIQMAGRVLRKHDGIEAKNIIQCQDTRCPFTKIARPRNSYLLVQNEFRSLESNVNIERISNQMIQKLVASSPKLPVFIQKAKSKLRRSRRSGVL